MDSKDVGTITIERKYDADRDEDTVHIVQADRRIRINDGLLRDIDRGDHKPHLWRIGDLHVSDDYGQRYIYRIRWDDYANGGYLAEWPD